MISDLQEVAATHVNAPTGLIGYLSQTAEQLLAEERSKTEPDPVNVII